MLTRNSQTKEKKDNKQLLLDLIARDFGTSNAIVMEKALKTQDKQIEEAMMTHGMTADQIGQSKGINLKIVDNLINGNSTQQSENQQPSQTLTQQPQQTTTQQQPDKNQGKSILSKLLISLGSGLASAGGQPELAGQLLKYKSMQGILSPEQTALKIEQANQALKDQGLEGYEAKLGANGQIMVSKSSGYDATTKPDEIKSAVEGIVSGNLPPDLKTISSYRDRTKLSAELANQGYDLNTANKDWLAANKFYSSMNSTQQVRLRQAINSVSGSLDNLDKLNSEYQRSGFTPANKAQLIANSKGVGRQAVLATEYLTTLGVIQDELSQVFMGGNSPTEKFLEQAQNILKSDFSFEQVSGVTKQLRMNLKYRLNSINQAQAYTPSSKTAEESKANKGEDEYEEYLKLIGGK